MSMICNLRRVPEHVLDQLLNEPSLISPFLYGVSVKKQNFIDRLIGVPPRMPLPVDPPILYPRSEDDEVDLDKAWHGLHCLFTQTAWEGEAPANYLLRGGGPIGKENVGYGPARGLCYDDVERFAAFLSPWTRDALQQRYDPAHFKKEDVYPNIWDEPVEEAFGYLWEYFEILREFVLKAEKRSEAIIIYLC